MANPTVPTRPKISKCIFIGLGGSGTLSLKYAKAKMLKQYGEIPPMIRFLGFDTDPADAISALQYEGLVVSLEKNEFCALTVGDGKKFLDYNPDITQWFPEKNRNAAGAITHGAGQIRSIGRLAVMANYDEVKAKVDLAATQVKTFKHTVNDKYEVTDGGITVCFAFSVAGGTGSGTFIDMAYLIKDALKLGPGDYSVGYILFPDIFTSMLSPIASTNVEPNTYGSMKELDYLLSGKLEGQEIAYGGGRKIKIDGTPFDVVVSVNNTNSGGSKYDDILQLTELIGSSMYLSTGALAVKAASVWDNVSKFVAGTKEVNGKRARYVGVGYSELLFQGEILQKLYGYKAANILINKLITVDETEKGKLETYIDAWKIREDNNANQVIDALLKMPQTAPENVEKYEVGAASELNTKSTNYIQNVKERAEKESEANLRVLLQKKDEIEKYLNSLLNGAGGVGTVKNILVQLIAKLNSFSGMMVSEKAKFVTERDNLGKVYKSKQDQIVEAEKSFVLGRKGKIEAACSEFIDVAKREATLMHEIIRREKANVFFGQLVAYCEQRKRDVDSIYSSLHESILPLFAKEIEDICVRRAIKPFVITLYKDFIELVNPTSENVSISEFIKSLGDEKSLSKWSMIKEGVFKNYILEYTNSLPEAAAYSLMTLNDALKKLMEKDPEYLKTILVKLDKLSEPLWQYEGESFKSAIRFDKAYYVGGANIIDGQTVINKDSIEHALGTKPGVCDTFDPQRISFQKIEYPAPAFALMNIPRYSLQYHDDAAAFDFHIDSNWKKKMSEEGFDLMPSSAKENLILVWALGFVFGFIKRDGYDYTVYSPEKGSAMAKKWFNLGKGKDRKEAYDEFVKQKFLKELSELLENKFKELGHGKVSEILGEIKQNIDVYYDKYSCIGLERATLEQRGYQDIKKLIEAEMTVVSNCEDRDLAKV